MIEIEEVLDMTRLSIPIILKIDHTLQENKDLLAATSPQ
jgi:hypothetical protein